MMSKKSLLYTVDAFCDEDQILFGNSSSTPRFGVLKSLPVSQKSPLFGRVVRGGYSKISLNFQKIHLHENLVLSRDLGSREFSRAPKKTLKADWFKFWQKRQLPFFYWAIFAFIACKMGAGKLEKARVFLIFGPFRICE